MNLSCLLSLIKEMPTYQQLVRQLSADKQEHKVFILGAAKPYVIAALHQELNSPLMVISAQPENARRLHEQLEVWCRPGTSLLHFAELDFLPYEYLASYPSNAMLERLRVLSSLAFHERGAKPLIVSSALAAITKTVSRKDFVASSYVLEQGMSADPLNLLRLWQAIGYEMEVTVATPGTMSRRGGIIDVFPPSCPLPVRIEFFGNEIESIRYFEPESQRSTKLVDSVTVTPAKEVAMARESGILASLDMKACASDVKHRFQEDMGKLLQGEWFRGAEFYFPLFNHGSIFDYMDDEALVVLDAPQEIETAVQRIYVQSRERRDTKLEHGELPPGFPFTHFAWEELESAIRAKQRLSLESWDSIGQQTMPFSPPQGYGGKLDRFLKAAKRMIEQEQRLLIVSHQANRLADLLQEEDVHVSAASQLEQMPPPNSITLLQGSLAEGWEMRGVLNLVTDAELFGFVKQARPSKKTLLRRDWLLPRLTPGSYVVHVDHGIGKFNGLTRMSTNGIEREYLILEYGGKDRLYVPTEQIERVSRYIGAGDQQPHLSRLGTQEWQKTKKRVKESVANIAQELLGLYAVREVSPGYAFSRDTLWQQELEASFPYLETPDQLEAIIAVKEDMEKPRPMDRLICGDVGYGKTEIALRAAFKAVMDNKQVAILVPTTILAQQHFITFRERLQTFPLRVEMLSRFCSPENEAENIKGLANGSVDICIGTHRLLQRDIRFKDLGIVIIDEEQRFGVVQKERLKQMKKEVDTLALSATPIPRTLHMSLSGLRDMSIMETPPEERLSIKTYIGAYDEDLLRQAMLRELERNGQAFFVHNRIQSIALAASKLQALVPEARIAIAHGRMPEEELEKVMADFIAGKYDILVSTIIIQLGLDMPNVNTMIVDQADKFGLAQLYQLRGRIGRGINQAYAYFFFNKGKELSPKACKRLETIQEATELGAGFSIAMRDLEIRGAGNLLGVKQSGHIAAIGFNLYCQLLAEAVEELKARQGHEAGRAIISSEVKQAPSIALPLTAHVPEEYVPDLNTRLHFYRKLAAAETCQETEDIAKELRDRFGELPQPVRNLLYAVKIKILAAEAGVSTISLQGRYIVIEPQRMDRLYLGNSYGGAVKPSNTQIRLDSRQLRNKWMEVLKEILTSKGTS
jgi:transcription-repair coupling factor (superfamily II helicase)